MNAFVKFGLSNTSCIVAVQGVRAVVERSVDPVLTAKEIIQGFTGQYMNEGDETFSRIVAQYAAEGAVRGQSGSELFFNSVSRAKSFCGDRKNAYLFVKKEKTAETVNDVGVVVKADGKIKRGGKQVMVANFYRERVLDAEVPMSNKAFVEFLMAELSMTKANAYTFSFNARKELGEPEGGIAKEKRGRKPKNA